MKKIELTKGKFALVSDEDYEYLTRWRWKATKGTSKWYAVRNVAITKRDDKGRRKYKVLYMHKVIAERAGLDVSEMIDHEDRDSLNNQRYNLRPATVKQNNENRQLASNNTSGHPGVYFNKRNKNKKWEARIFHYGKQVFLGNYTTKEEAIKARKEAEKKYYTHAEACT